MQQAGNLLVPVALNFVQLKNGPVAGGKGLQSARKRNPIKRKPQPIILPARFTPCGRYGILLTGFIQGDLTRGLFSKMHKRGRHRDPVQPSGQCGFAAKGAQFSEYPDEDVLGQIVGFRCVVRHPKQHSVYAVFMQVKQRGECIWVAFQGSPYKSNV
jgi:hypothetical protein